MKRFNYTGTCIPEKNYMADTSKKISQIVKHINYGEYFIISRPRQYGKTTIISLLEEKLKNDYVLLSLTFEAKGEETFETFPVFAGVFIKNINSALEKSNHQNLKITFSEKINTFDDLSDLITSLIKKSEKKVILIIDEVDRATNFSLFNNFLGMLRNKFLMARKNQDFTFYSVVLAGVHDIKNIKMKMRNESETQYNSPWNIAIDFKVVMSFSAEEISVMLADYEKDHNTVMDIKNMSDRLYEFTSGYPVLVSKLCYLMDEELGSLFTEDGLEKALKILLNESNTLFDDLIKNITSFSDLYNLLERVVLDGEEITYNVHAHQMGIMYGIFKESKNNKLTVHNKIFEIILYNYLIARREMTKGVSLDYKYSDKFEDNNGNLNMELVLEKFQELMIAEYREIDEKFVEREGRLLFLAFIKPVINGTGFYFVEPETRKSNRMDVVITYNKQKFVIELKIWRGGKYEQEGREQLCEYLTAQKLEKGYMVFFNFNKNKEYSKNRVIVNRKEIFEITV